MGDTSGDLASPAPLRSWSHVIQNYPTLRSGCLKRVKEEVLESRRALWLELPSFFDLRATGWPGTGGHYRTSRCTHALANHASRRI
ncbi:hypothetical protein OBBRIDRAFT_789990 [Obba rivulosa]|uniref:Uncharacterized protein n=1 Tax=Obba rivulosa TaxID=1052685 RepID=A0A8E2DPY2_9APHY|nr:hypothetical protein OBBRIDRAFT_789990 [Obba rivulosa]